MNKDAILATVIGFVVGLIITGLILIGPRLMAMLPDVTLPKITLPADIATPSASPSSSSFEVIIASPLADSIEVSSGLLVSGTSQPGATIIIQTDSDDEVIMTAGDGKYAGKITLVEGRNDLTVTAYLKGKQATQQRTVYFTSEEF